MGGMSRNYRQWPIANGKADSEDEEDGSWAGVGFELVMGLSRRQCRL
jgi:hypothetical protein